MPVAIVTGANKGIGFGIVRGLCKKFQGDVYLTSRDEARGLVIFSLYVFSFSKCLSRLLWMS